MTEKQSKNLHLDDQTISSVIHLVRGEKVMLDEDLAKIYGVETKVLNQAVRRNKERFPEDFMFKLSVEEFVNLKSQFVTSSWGGRRKWPLVFTEHGAVMLASVLRSKRAIRMSIEVVKAFVQLRYVLASQKNMENQLMEIRSFMLKQSNQTDREFKKVWKAIEDLTNPPDNKPNRPIGF